MPDAINTTTVPDGLKLLHNLQVDQDTITQLSWSSDGEFIASSCIKGIVSVWETKSGKRIKQEDLETPIYGFSWSPHKNVLVLASGENGITFWDIKSNSIQNVLESAEQPIYSVAWSPDGKIIAAGNQDFDFTLWDPIKQKKVNRKQVPNTKPAKGIESITIGSTNIVIGNNYIIHGEIATNNFFFGDSKNNRLYNGYRTRRFPTIEDGRYVHKLIWLPNNKSLVIISGKSRVDFIEDAYLVSERGNKKYLMHDDWVLSASYNLNGEILATGCGDGTIRIWDPAMEQQKRILEGHADAITSVDFSADGRFLTSKSLDGTIRLWRCDTWETITIIYETASISWPSNIAFHPFSPLLATIEPQNSTIKIWELDIDHLGKAAPISPTVHYTNAKVVLMGDTGVGKTGIGTVLTGHSFRPTESTHGRHVWSLDKRGGIANNSNQAEQRETLLWDLAGQPGYRLIHQLHLNQVVLGLIVFDSRSETDPFAGVRYWDRALRQAQRVNVDAMINFKKFLVAARADRGGVGVSSERVKAVIDELEFDNYFETSAKEGWGIPELAEAISLAINWDSLPKVSSTQLFTQIKDFLLEEKKSGRLLSTLDDLYRSFIKSVKSLKSTEELLAQFITCVGRLESQDLIRRLNFGNLVLLQPEILDAYASSLVNAAKEEPDGLGSIAEEDALQGRFKMSEDERVTSKDQERLLLIATVEELLQHEIVLREQTDAGTILIFPSQFTREWPDAPDPEGKEVVFRFDGSILNIYTTLAIRLARSGFFDRKDMWKNAAIYSVKGGGECGLWLREIKEGTGELTLFFEESTSEQTRYQFTEYVHAHLQRRSIPQSITQQRIVTCPECGTPLTARQINLRLERGFNWILCNVCETKIDLEEDRGKFLENLGIVIPEMDLAASTARNEAAQATILKGKMATDDFDVFISYSSKDRRWISEWLIPHLEAHGIHAHIDYLHFEVGVPALVNMENAVKKCHHTILVLTPNWTSSEWTSFESLLLQSQDPTNIRNRLLPIMLNKCELPTRLGIFTYADFTDPVNWDNEFKRIVKAINEGQHNQELSTK